jgi:hypothetical protein
VVVKGRWRQTWLARRVVATHRDAPCAAVVLDAGGNFLAGLAALPGASVAELVPLVCDDPRWLGEAVQVLYIEARPRPTASLADLARWHDLVVRHAERGHIVTDWLLVDRRTGRVRSMARRFGSAGGPAASPAVRPETTK